ncbi:DUF4189 domain-containing protein [Ralstonia pickettii]|jgi:hypothetical protein|uniref:DUF4189 domain-containing protein n=1 Tax=Ralstonia TaxID=48736 RepID=UPI0009E2C2AB|nr:DUF4189 domain-containing protein [Ralstonia insidiosa]MBX3773410.1 DUF4189 domain-containing protein [Ralstonia pickettii]NOZ18814.1 DUF4189 domain-containing protein [Betaproteobacteria bacterium]MBA9870581.1 DUF4189 domain-containing protein [Ralstonia insidiosa]MBA9914411.1 DUF4189 domain-containing protein [Ralstonia insidiosa]
MKKRWLLLLSLPSLCSNAFAAAALAGADTPEGIAYYFVGGQPTVAKARELALRECRSGSGAKGTCSIAGATEGPRYWAVFHASNGSVGLAWNRDRQKAIDEAHAQCGQRGECPDEAAHVWFDEGQAKKVAAAPAASGNCRPPTGKVLRSETYCENGDCSRRFENGCVVHFQAAYCYDPLEQKFVWKPDGC